MRGKKGAIPESPRTPREDMEIINKLNADQVWLYVLARSSPAGSRILPDEMILERLGVDPTSAVSLQQVFGFSMRQIALFQRSPASTLAWLVSEGLNIDYGNLIVDVACTAAASMREALKVDLSQVEQLNRMQENLSRIDRALTQKAVKQD